MQVSDETELLFLPSSHQEVDGQLQQIFLPYRNREELLTSTSRTETDNVANASEQKVESLVQNTSRPENTAFSEVVAMEVVKLKRKHMIS